MYAKRLPFSKTLVFEFKAILADVLARTTPLKGSIACPILDVNGFNNGDQNIQVSTPLEIVGVKTFLILSCYDAFTVTITEGASQVYLKSMGLFVHTGEIEKVSIEPTGLNPIRLQYIWS